MTSRKQQQWPFSKNSRIGLLGYGVEGRATAEYLQKHGFTNIEIRDKNHNTPIPTDFNKKVGPYYLDGLEQLDVIFRSPSFRPDLPALVTAEKNGCQIQSTLNLFLQLAPCQVVGVTGTVGKGTTSSILATALSAAGKTCYLGGNIGTSPFTFLDKLTPDDIVVLEISSFQSMDLQFSPQMAIILKTTSEHLDWHLSEAEYHLAKANLVSHQHPEDTVLFHHDTIGSQTIGQYSTGRQFSYSTTGPVNRGIFLDNGRFTIADSGQLIPLPLHKDEVTLKGDFNLENISAALFASYQLGADMEKVSRSCARFGGLPHRLEKVSHIDGITYYNDSYATRPDATIAAINSFSEKLFLILGGSEKNADFSELVELVRTAPQICFVGLIGHTAKRLKALIGNHLQFPVATFDTIEAAVDMASRQTPTGGVVLLSPACASFGLFKNYKERGERFRQAVANLRK